MPDFNVRSDSVNVEQIMEQIRARIREKRGVDYTEQQIRELAAVKLEKFLDPRGVRSDLLDQFRKAQPAYTPPELPNYAFEDETLYASTRSPLRWLRKLLNPILKLFFNPNPLIQALNIQSRLNTMYGEREARREATRRAFDQLQYELMHNLVIETTRLSIEVKNLKMRVESLTGRLEFNERRARALESVVAYKPSGEEAPIAASSAVREPGPVVSAGATHRDGGPRPDTGRPQPSAPHAQQAQPQGGQAQPGEGPGQRSRRRRRRRGRRGGGGSAQGLMGGQQPTSSNPATPTPPTDFVAVPPTEGVPTEPADSPAPAGPSFTPDVNPSTRPDHEARSGQGPSSQPDHDTRPGPSHQDDEAQERNGPNFSPDDHNADSDPGDSSGSSNPQ